MSDLIQAASNLRVLVVGSTNTDFIMALPKLPGQGETVTDGRFTQTFGGKGANQAVAAARAGASVELITGVGRDAFGQQMLDNFQSEGIDHGFTVRVEGTASGSALVMFDKSGKNYLAVAPGANHSLAPDDLDQADAAFARAAVLVLQMEVSHATNRRALEIGRAKGVTVLLNYAPAIGDPDGLTRRADVLVVNEVEAASLLEVETVTPHEAPQSARALRDRGPTWAIITLGDAGYVAAGPDEALLREPSLAVDAIDTTAAGDTFCGVLAAKLAERLPMSEALRYANVAGALATTITGAQPSIPRGPQIAEFFADLPS